MLLVAPLAVQPEMPEAPAAAGGVAGRRAEAGHPPDLHPARSELVIVGSSASGDGRTAAAQIQRAPAKTVRNLRAGVVAEKVRAGGLGPLTSCT